MADQKIKPSTPRSNEQLAQAVRHPAPGPPTGGRKGHAEAD